jgi:hypothetical protein
MCELSAVMATVRAQQVPTYSLCDPECYCRILNCIHPGMLMYMWLVATYPA